MIRRFFKKLRRSLSYAIIGWSNEDWGYDHLMELMRFKLKRIEHNLINGKWEHDKHTLQSLRLAIKLLDRLMNRDHGYTFDRAHEEKWGELSCEFIPAIWDDKGEPLYYEGKCSRPNATTKEEKAQSQEEGLAAFKMGEKLRNQDKAKLFKIMDKYMERWWD